MCALPDISQNSSVDISDVNLENSFVIRRDDNNNLLAGSPALARIRYVCITGTVNHTNYVLCWYNTVASSFAIHIHTISLLDVRSIVTVIKNILICFYCLFCVGFKHVVLLIIFIVSGFIVGYLRF